jgi:hypothetical protein
MPWGTGASRAPRPDSRPAGRPRLQVVPRVQRARGSRFVVLVAAMLVGGLIGLLMLNLSMQKGAFELAGLQEQTRALKTTEQSLAFDMERLESTQHLSRKATALGMVPNTNPVFLDLTDGSIMGTPEPAAPGAVVPQQPAGETDETGASDATVGDGNASTDEPDAPARRRDQQAGGGETGGSRGEPGVVPGAGGGGRR